MKKIIILPFFILLSVWLSAQEVISTAGQTQSISGYEISWTLGEPVIATVTAGTTVLTQGFHQSKLTVTAIDEFPASDFEVTVFPNPTSDFVIVHLVPTTINAGLSLFEFSGKLLQQHLITESDTRVNLSGYASGTYILKLYQKDKTPVQSFKIIKH
jgi:hypothetical protein